MIIDARGGDVGVPEPFLRFGYAGLVIERIGGDGRAQRMRADLAAPNSAAPADRRQVGDAIGKERPPRHLRQQIGDADARQHGIEALGQGLGLRSQSAQFSSEAAL
jgi:hypothetical protein